MPTVRRYALTVLALTAFAACVALMLSLGGCSDDGTIYVQSTPVSGNWQVSAASNGIPLPSLSGALTGNQTTAAVTGVLHSDLTTGCATMQDAFPVTGSTDFNGITTLTGSVAGGTLTITGKLALDGQSLSNVSYNISGGQCAFTGPTTAAVQNYGAVTGTYTGSFSDPDGKVIDVTANLTQATTGDTSGNFQLSGTGSFGSNPCFVSPVTVSNSQVTGWSFRITYADSVTGNSVTAVGTISTDGTTLTVTNWSMTGPCGADSGTGTLTQQAATT
jgi:hypothetical protein